MACSWRSPSDRETKTRHVRPGSEPLLTSSQATPDSGWADRGVHVGMVIFLSAAPAQGNPPVSPLRSSFRIYRELGTWRLVWSKESRHLCPMRKLVMAHSTALARFRDYLERATRWIVRRYIKLRS